MTCSPIFVVSFNGFLLFLILVGMQTSNESCGRSPISPTNLKMEVFLLNDDLTCFFK